VSNNEERKLWKTLSNVQTNRRKKLEHEIQTLKNRITELEEQLEAEKALNGEWIRCPHYIRTIDNG